MIESTTSSDHHQNHNRNHILKFGQSTVLVVLLIGISFFTGYLFFKGQYLEKGGGTTQQLDQTTLPIPTDLKIKKPTSDEHWTGPKDAKFVLVEYSDLECPFCKSVHPTLIKLMRESQGKVAWVFRHYPQIEEHKKSQKLAEAVECAAELGGEKGFWNMTDTIYKKMPNLELVELGYLAGSVGLSENTLRTCLDSNKFESKVNSAQKEAKKVGFRMIPSTVIYNLSNDKTLLIEGAVPYDQFKTQLATFIK